MNDADKNYQAHPNMLITFAHLRRVCIRKGWSARMNIFDCGHYVAVHDEQGRQVVSKTWRCGEDEYPDGAAQCAIWLMQRGRLTLGEFNAD
jgi:hypothetical protein